MGVYSNWCHLPNHFPHEEWPSLRKIMQSRVFAWVMANKLPECEKGQQKDEMGWSTVTISPQELRHKPSDGQSLTTSLHQLHGTGGNQLELVG